LGIAHTISPIVADFSAGATVFGCTLSFFAGIIVIGKLLILEQHRSSQIRGELEIERKRREEWQKRFWKMQGIAQRAAEACADCTYRKPEGPDSSG
jgi:hypothetical protein